MGHLKFVYKMTFQIIHSGLLLRKNQQIDYLWNWAQNGFVDVLNVKTWIIIRTTKVQFHLSSSNTLIVLVWNRFCFVFRFNFQVVLAVLVFGIFFRVLIFSRFFKGKPAYFRFPFDFCWHHHTYEYVYEELKWKSVCVGKFWSINFFSKSPNPLNCSPYIDFENLTPPPLPVWLKYISLSWPHKACENSPKHRQHTIFLSSIAHKMNE